MKEHPDLNVLVSNVGSSELKIYWPIGSSRIPRDAEPLLNTAADAVMLLGLG